MSETALELAALQYHQYGLPVIPVGPDKKPSCFNWGHWRRRKQTEAEVRSFPWHKLYGLALLTWPASDVVVLDFDGPHAGALWEAKGIVLPDTAMNHTRSGGLHRIFTVPSGTRQPGTGNGRDPQRKIRLVVDPHCGCKKPCGVDLLLNGYFVAPPTPGYREDPDHPFEPGRLASIPLAVLTLAQSTQRTTGDAPLTTSHHNSGWVEAAMRGVPEGQRDETCTRLAGYWLHRLHGNMEETLMILRPWAARCEPPFPEADLRKCVQSVARKEQTKTEDAAALPTLDAPVAVLRKSQNQGDPVPTGLRPLDERLRGGLRPAKALVIGAPAGHGKTALCLQIANAASASGCAVAYVAADEGREPVIIRLGQQLGFPRDDLESGHGGTLDAMERELAMRLIRFPDPDAEGDVTIEGVAGALAREFPDHRKMLLVDSIQTARIRRPVEERLSIRERVEANARTARRVALEHNLIMVYVSEVNRGWYRSKKADERSSDLAAFAETRAIEFSADVLLTMRASEEDPDLVDVRIPKNRLGQRTPFLLRLDRKRALFTPVQGEMISDAKDKVLAALVERQRGEIMRALQQQPRLTTIQLSEAVGGKRQAFLEALRELKASGLVVWEPKGRSVVYRLNDVQK